MYAFGTPRNHRACETGYTYFYRMGLDEDGDETELEFKVRYSIVPGYRSSWSEPEIADDVIFELPDGLVLTADEERDLTVKVMERHVWES